MEEGSARKCANCRSTKIVGGRIRATKKMWSPAAASRPLPNPAREKQTVPNKPCGSEFLSGIIQCVGLMCARRGVWTGLNHLSPRPSWICPRNFPSVKQITRNHCLNDIGAGNSGIPRKSELECTFLRGGFGARKAISSWRMVLVAEF